jgi:hypothetical protein
MIVHQTIVSQNRLTISFSGGATQRQSLAKPSTLELPPSIKIMAALRRPLETDVRNHSLHFTTILFSNSSTVFLSPPRLCFLLFQVMNCHHTKTAGETLNRLLNALICATLSCLFPLRISDTTP